MGTLCLQSLREERSLSPSLPTASQLGSRRNTGSGTEHSLIHFSLEIARLGRFGLRVLSRVRLEVEMQVATGSYFAASLFKKFPREGLLNQNTFNEVLKFQNLVFSCSALGSTFKCASRICQNLTLSCPTVTLWIPEAVLSCSWYH